MDQSGRDRGGADEGQEPGGERRAHVVGVRGGRQERRVGCFGRWLPADRKQPKRRVIGAPKFYFADVGIVNAKRGGLLPDWELYGRARENWVFQELTADGSKALVRLRHSKAWPIAVLAPLLRCAAPPGRFAMPDRTANEKIAEELSRHGLRATRQRIAALRLLRLLKSHPTSAELHARMLREHRNVSQKTVYEILDALVQAGLASRVTAVGEPYRYEARSEPHHHATCRVCGRLYDVPANADSRIRGRSSLPAGFQVEQIDVTIHGVCLRCRGRL